MIQTPSNFLIATQVVNATYNNGWKETTIVKEAMIKVFNPSEKLDLNKYKKILNQFFNNFGISCVALVRNETIVMLMPTSAWIKEIKPMMNNFSAQQSSLIKNAIIALNSNNPKTDEID